MDVCSQWSRPIALLMSISMEWTQLSTRTGKQVASRCRVEVTWVTFEIKVKFYNYEQWAYLGFSLTFHIDFWLLKDVDPPPPQKKLELKHQWRISTVNIEYNAHRLYDMQAKFRPFWGKIEVHMYSTHADFDDTSETDALVESLLWLMAVELISSQAVISHSAGRVQ